MSVGFFKNKMPISAVRDGVAQAPPRTGHGGRWLGSLGCHAGVLAVDCTDNRINGGSVAMAYSAYRCYLTPLGALLLFSFFSSLPFNYLRFAAFIYAPTATLYGRF